MGTYRFTCDNDGGCKTVMALIAVDLDSAKLHADIDYGWYCGKKATYCHKHRLELGV